MTGANGTRRPTNNRPGGTMPATRRPSILSATLDRYAGVRR